MLDPAAGHALLKLSGATQYEPKTRNSIPEARQAIQSADMFTIVLPAQENGTEEKMVSKYCLETVLKLHPLQSYYHI